jgi:drug/metabolite transporter (DMT)-like permease
MGGTSEIGISAHAPAVRANRLALLRLTLAVLAISFTPILFRLSEVGPSATAFYRTCLALPIILGWMLVERRRAPAAKLVARDALTLVIGGIVFAINIVNYAWAVQLTAVANASLLSNLSPLFVTLGSFLFLRERVTRGFLAAMLAAIAGVAILASDRLAIGEDELLGDGVALLSAMSFAAYLVIIGRLRLRVGPGTVMLWTGIVTALVLLGVSLASGEAMVPLSPRGWVVLLALAVFSYAIGQGLLTVALAELGAAFSAVALLCLPVSAALLGWVVLGEALSATQGIGGAIILASILGARLAGR